MRVSELCGINVDDFRDEDALLVRGKDRKERLVVFGEYAQACDPGMVPIRLLLAKMKLETGAVLFSAVRISSRPRRSTLGGPSAA